MVARLHGVWVVLAVGFVVGLSGCRGPAEVDAYDPVGTYDIISVDGVAMPGRVMHHDVEIEVHQGVFVIDPDGTCKSLTVFGHAGGEPITREVTAVYTRQGPDLTMQWDGAGRTTGTVEGDRFTMNNEGMVFTYERR